MFIGMFVRSSAMYNVELYLGLALFSLYCIADTQIMIQRALKGHTGMYLFCSNKKIKRLCRRCDETLRGRVESICQSSADHFKVAKA